VKLARLETQQKATYTAEGSAARLIATNPEFAKAFDRAKARIREMHVRYVEEPDCNRQALLEIYATLALGTAYNDFETH